MMVRSDADVLREIAKDLMASGRYFYAGEVFGAADKLERLESELNSLREAAVASFPSVSHYRPDVNENQ